tara:strand:- start:77 stop:781 length:705 start_codon:yes stop_codon:yes gene_type:complete
VAKNLFRHLNLYYWLRKLSFSKLFQNFRFFNDSFKRKIIFYYIFKSLHWRDYNKTQSEESVSGLGSDVRITEKLVLELSGFIKDNQIKSLLDVACGDFIWMKNIVNENKSLRYFGLEIVNDIVENNNKRYSNSRIKFDCVDVINSKLPNNYDLILVRDFFIHIKNDDIKNLLKKIKSSNCKYFAINNFPEITLNKEVKNYGHHRLFNVEIEPFNLKDPCKVIADHDRKLNIYKI